MLEFSNVSIYKKKVMQFNLSGAKKKVAQPRATGRPLKILCFGKFFLALRHFLFKILPQIYEDAKRN